MDCDTDARILLERMIIDANVVPTKLPLSLLKVITSNFSDDQKIGSGGFGIVYKGLLTNGTIAVKRLSKIEVDEKKFNQEIDSLMRVKHKNIVRFLGYCADTQGRAWKYKGKYVMAEERQRLLCFEFVPEGSLDKYISDASGGLEWRTRYQIIKGICEGIDYLHCQKIVHLDLKPANILMDHCMNPKIADFGLSKCFEERQTRAMTLNPFGTQGYMAPEFYDGVITFKSDIYSLGVIIIEILTGQKGYPETESVLESWSTRFQTSKGSIWLEHVSACTEIAKMCISPNPMERPLTGCIIEMLHETEHRYGFIETDNDSETHGHKLLEVYPLEVCFSLEPNNNKRIECPVTLTNRTDHHVGVWITPTSATCCPDSSSALAGFPYLWEPQESCNNELGSTVFCGLGPNSSIVIYMTMMKQQPPPPPLHANMGTFDVVMFATKSKEALGDLECYLTNASTKMNKLEESLWMEVKGLGTQVYRAMLTATIVTYDPAARSSCYEVVTHQFTQGLIRRAHCIDVHPTGTWILVGHEGGYVSIWNYETQERAMVFNVIDLPKNNGGHTIRSIKFIMGRQWFAAGDASGLVHVYAYATRGKVKEFEAHSGTVVSSLAVHPTNPSLLTASCSGRSIKLWDWSEDWTCTRVFENADDTVWHLMFGPRGTNTFASVSSHSRDVKVWDIHSSAPIARLDQSGQPPMFYINRHRQFLITTWPGFPGSNANIWNLKTKKLVHILHMRTKCNHRIACHHTLPILATVPHRSNQKHILLWDARTYRVMERVELFMDGPIICMVFNGIEDLTRLVVATSKKVSIIKINLRGLWTADGN